MFMPTVVTKLLGAIFRCGVAGSSCAGLDHFPQVIARSPSHCSDAISSVLSREVGEISGQCLHVDFNTTASLRTMQVHHLSFERELLVSIGADNTEGVALPNSGGVAKTSLQHDSITAIHSSTFFRMAINGKCWCEYEDGLTPAQFWGNTKVGLQHDSITANHSCSTFFRMATPGKCWSRHGAVP